MAERARNGNEADGWDVAGRWDKVNDLSLFTFWRSGADFEIKTRDGVLAAPSYLLQGASCVRLHLFADKPALCSAT